MAMKLDDLFEAAFTARRTVWSKRGKEITRREIDLPDATELRLLTKVEIVPDAKP